MTPTGASRRGSHDAEGKIGVLVVEATETLPLSVVETDSFGRDARKIFTDDQLGELYQHIGIFRELGVVIPGTGGLRKVRWSAQGKGKRGGARVIYYYGGNHMPIFMIAAYSKSEKADMTSSEKKAATKLVDVLRAEWAQPKEPKSAKRHGKRR